MGGVLLVAAGFLSIWEVRKEEAEPEPLAGRYRRQAHPQPDSGRPAIQQPEMADRKLPLRRRERPRLEKGLQEGARIIPPSSPSGKWKLVLKDGTTVTAARMSASDKGIVATGPFEALLADGAVLRCNDPEGSMVINRDGKELALRGTALTGELKTYDIE